MENERLLNVRLLDLSNYRYRKILRLTFLMMFAVFKASTLYAHQDRIYELKDDGTIEGLGEYGPASLVVAKDLEDRIAKIEFTLRGMTFKFPSCLYRIFELPVGQKIQIRGSYHHDITRFPPYIIIALPMSFGPFGMYDGHDIMFNLITMEMTGVTKHVIELSTRPDYVGSYWEETDVYYRLCRKSLRD